MKEEHEAYRLEYKGWGDIEQTEPWIDIEKRYRKRYNKLFADACEVEHRHLTSLAEALAKEFKVDKEKIKTIMETCGGATEDLYLYVKQNRYTI